MVSNDDIACSIHGNTVRDIKERRRANAKSVAAGYAAAAAATCHCRDNSRSYNNLADEIVRVVCDVDVGAGGVQRDPRCRAH